MSEPDKKKDGEISEHERKAIENLHNHLKEKEKEMTNTPSPCDMCNNLYYDVMTKDDPTASSECLKKLEMGNEECPSFSQYKGMSINKELIKPEGVNALTDAVEQLGKLLDKPRPQSNMWVASVYRCGEAVADLFPQDEKLQQELEEQHRINGMLARQIQKYQARYAEEEAAEDDALEQKMKDMGLPIHDNIIGDEDETDTCSGCGGCGNEQ